MVSEPAITRRSLLGGLALGTLGGPARAAAPRVVTLDGLFTETLLGIGLVPVAAANRPLYERLTAQPALPPEVVDLGPLQEPNLELLRLMRPDLLVAATWQAQTQGALARIAPVAAFPTTAGNAPSPLDHLDTLTRALGRRVGHEAQAEARIAETGAALAQARATLAGHLGRPAYICRLREDGRVAMFGARCTVGDVAARVGLANAWSGGQSGSGTAFAGIEDLGANPDAILIHFDRGRETVRALARLDTSPIWRALPFVRLQRVVAMPVVHPNGALPSAARFAGQLAAALQDIDLQDIDRQDTDRQGAQAGTRRR
ncbi:ABC transporter substrate-binding protein [Methylobacterium sp. J-068]|uniref:ABC transporter substrate-binding protein n=1 Tax=Methylobacterium sp. J-068 TaxID=2836649 RepID=UPI001FB91B98|nr:ABC transporter substrate-binding protein [Methylobacterium sp. J-068]MCJ2036122.1 ABC transporter substrate-binding protein [Methylobacterium sp. J-068]